MNNLTNTEGKLLNILHERTAETLVCQLIIIHSKSIAFEFEHES